MHFDERTDGEYRIYAGALEGLGGHGYIAAVVVSRSVDPLGRRLQVVYRDDSISCGHRWASPQCALNQALARGRLVVDRERQRVAC